MTNLRVGAFLLVLTASSLGFAQTATNRINSIKAVGNTVELEFTSPQEFVVRDAAKAGMDALVYNADADKKSWAEMLRLFKQVFGS